MARTGGGGEGGGAGAAQRGVGVGVQDRPEPIIGPAKGWTRWADPRGWNRHLFPWPLELLRRPRPPKLEERRRKQSSLPAWCVARISQRGARVRAPLATSGTPRADAMFRLARRLETRL